MPTARRQAVEIIRLKDAGIRPTEIANRLGIGRASVYRRSFESCCGSAANAIVVFGHSLAASDWHVLRFIAKGGCSDLAVSLFGNPDSTPNQAAILSALSLQQERVAAKGKKSALQVTFYDAASAHVWG